MAEMSWNIGTRSGGQRRALLALGLSVLLCAGAPPVEFVPVGAHFAAATDEYRQMWETDGARIVEAMERATGLPFPELSIEIFVHEGAPMTSFDGRSIRLRAGYSPLYKRATLVHELGHCLARELPRTAEVDDHRTLYLFLYDVWTDLYGQEFADRMVSIERRIRGPYDYDAAWTWALSMTREQRQAKLRDLRALRGQASANQSAESSRPRLRYAVELNPNAR
ncbi:MAG: hypothetical protein ACXWU1_06535 [Allosphingosinicella sp.]